MAPFGKPRLFRLVETASRAELLRRKRHVRGYALRAGFGAAAAVFGLLLLFGLHVAAWAALGRVMGSVWAALVVVALDAAAVAVLASLAVRGRTDPVADDAVSVRNAALLGAQLEVRTLGGLLRNTAADAPPAAPRGRSVRVYPPPP